jgi:hypothetical protein
MLKNTYVKPVEGSVPYTINIYLEGRSKNKGKKPDERYASFDYCYNYF